MISPSKLYPLVRDSLVLNFDPGLGYIGTINNIIDLSGTGKTISSNTTVSFSTGPPSSYSFVGGSSILSYNVTSDFQYGTGDFTLSCWVNMNSYSQASFIDQRSSSGTVGPYLGATSGGKLFVFCSGSTIVTGTITMVVGKWYNCVLTRIGTSLTIYVNGIANGTVSNSSTFNDTRFDLGHNISVSSTNGFIGQILVYKGLGLSATQVLNNFNNKRAYYGV